jgi:hypothetical protein
MAEYRLEVLARQVLARPEERPLHRPEFQAPNDAEAIERADRRWREYVAFYEDADGVSLDRYVLYQGDRVVREHVKRKH